jgi:phenylpropionate dioxygenase-like ring-hydroxylating dioxygenase large terminal subunit
MTDTLPISKINLESQLEPAFNWKNCWYPVAFLEDLAKDRPHCFSIYEIPLVLFKDAKEKWGCLEDRCSHRAAKLSDGQILDGKIECLYHGWQFSAEGKCLHIPQLTEQAKIPERACVKSYPVVEHQGVAWVWMGDSFLADETLIAHESNLDKKGMTCVDTLADLPFEQTFLVENFLDPAHVYFSHDRTELGIKRENAQPLEIEISVESAKGFKGRYRSSKNAPWGKVEFVAPHIVRYIFGNQETGAIFGFVLYALPLTSHSSRVLVRRYGNIFPKLFKLKPRWLEHLRQNKVLEEDLFFIIAQQQYLSQSGKSIKDVYLPLKSSDTLLMEHRKWLDKYGSDLPFYQGYATSKLSQSSEYMNSETVALDRLTRHTQLCHSCSEAYQTTQKLQQALLALALILAAGGIILEGWLQVLIVLTALSCVLLTKLFGQLKARFEQAYRRG